MTRHRMLQIMFMNENDNLYLTSWTDDSAYIVFHTFRPWTNPSWMDVFNARGATRMARGGIRLVHGPTKNTLITYFSGMKKDPKYAFLHAFFLICLSCSFQNLSIWPKTHPFFQFCTFLHLCTPKQCTHVQCLVLKNNPNYVNFWTSLIPPWHSSGPPGFNVRILAWGIEI